ncbi:cytochrome c oxidase subunit 3 [Mucilaginibacter arboris]|uniref:cytochrome-c oxidase n=1 Tax=Mucilaginibacter arboris TaxID=2682090 RepID=A0A7K1SV32_9SPHI|nr:cytochrome c oxidase subunit 3 [Mucilaginibacter arboris]MVN21144.1 heme-copper oxidase subunit III [Mucilaginibacter arboris]
MSQSVIDKEKLNLQPKKFNMWLFIITSFMLFAAFTSGFIVYTQGSADKGIKIILPHAFIYSTIVILLSSGTMYLAFRAAKQLQFSKQRQYLWLTLILGIGFFCLQFYAWTVLVKMGVYLINPNASQSFIYIFTGVHLVHILAGLILVINSLVGSYKNAPPVKNIFRLEMASIFWHFVDILWIYLYVFLLLNQ